MAQHRQDQEAPGTGSDVSDERVEDHEQQEPDKWGSDEDANPFCPVVCLSGGAEGDAGGRVPLVQRLAVDLVHIVVAEDQWRLVGPNEVGNCVEKGGFDGPQAKDMAVIGDIDEAVVDGDELQAAPESLGRVVVTAAVSDRGIQVLLPGLVGVF